VGGINQMKELTKIDLNCECFEDIAIKQNANIIYKEQLEENSNKYHYINGKGELRFAIEKSSIYDSDGYINTVWIFKDNFTTDQAIEFLNNNK
jgi:hypothetical protein